MSGMKRSFVSVLGLVLLLAACHGPGTTTFVNQSDQGQTLVLTHSPSVKMRLISTFHGVQHGDYYLTTPGKSTAGEYVLTDKTLSLESSEGTTLQSYEVMEDSSLRDASGNLWRPATVKEVARLRAVGEP